MSMTRNRGVLFCLSIALACSFGVRAAAEEAGLSHEQLVKMGLKASEKEMGWWRDAKFGIIIHWGVGVEKRHATWANKTDDTGEADKAYWDKLSKNLAEVDKFDAAKWMQVVKESGARYVVFATRHNGTMQRRRGGTLCLWDTQTTDHKITNPKSPFKHDVCRQIADAAHKAGIKLVWGVSGEAGKAVEELLTNYGKVDGVRFDGVTPGEGFTYQDALRKMRKLQPGILTNGRIAGNTAGGDYDVTQHDPPFPGWHARPVEVAAILSDGPWYWGKANPSAKSLEQVVHLLMRSVGEGANLVLSLAPAPDGAMERNEVTRAKEIGDWLKRNGESVYGTRPGPYRPAAWGVCTRKGKTIYLHMLQNLDKGKLTLRPIDKKIVKSRLVTGGEVTVEQTKDGVTITVPKKHVKPVDTIIALELAGPASEARVTPPAATSLTRGKNVSAEHVFFWPVAGITREMNGPQRAVDGDFDTGWCSRPATRKESDVARWLNVDLGAPATVGRALVAASRALESHPKGIKAFAIQYKKGDEWVMCFYSKSVRGRARKRWAHEVAFPPVTARFFRLGVRGRNTYIREFQLFAPH